MGHAPPDDAKKSVFESWTIMLFKPNLIPNFELDCKEKVVESLGIMLFPYFVIVHQFWESDL